MCFISGSWRRTRPAMYQCLSRVHCGFALHERVRLYGSEGSVEGRCTPGWAMQGGALLRGHNSIYDTTKCTSALQCGDPVSPELRLLLTSWKTRRQHYGVGQSGGEGLGVGLFNTGKFKVGSGLGGRREQAVEWHMHERQKEMEQMGQKQTITEAENGFNLQQRQRRRHESKVFHR